MNKAYEVGWVVRVLYRGELIKDNRPSENFLEKHKFCPEKADLVVQPWCKKEKEKCKCLKIKHLHFVWYPVDYLFSNQFMEDLGRIYSLRKYFPSFDDM